MTLEEAKQEIPNFKAFKNWCCTRCTANDWYCPSNCDLLDKAEKMNFEDIQKSYARNAGDDVKVCRYIKQKKCGERMKIYKEVEQIMRHYDEIEYLIDRLTKKIDVPVGLDLSFDFKKADLVELTNDQIKSYRDYLNNSFLVEQHTGYSGYDYYGYVYFATKEKNKFIKVYFEC